MSELSDKELRDMQQYGFLPRENQPIMISVMSTEILELRAQVADLESENKNSKDMVRRHAAAMNELDKECDELKRRLSVPVKLPSVPRKGYQAPYLAGNFDYYERVKVSLKMQGFAVDEGE